MLVAIWHSVHSHLMAGRDSLKVDVTNGGHYRSTHNVQATEILNQCRGRTEHVHEVGPKTNKQWLH